MSHNEEDDGEDHDEDACEESVVGAGAVDGVVVSRATHEVVLVAAHHAHRLNLICAMHTRRTSKIGQTYYARWAI